MSKNYHAEETEYAKVTTACKEIEKALEPFDIDSLENMKGSAEWKTIDLIRELVESFVDSLGMGDKREDLERSRRQGADEGRGVMNTGS
jgi:hypothetical protein